ncbi:hypothetical protein POM88_029572 [Heracleum sosnowskyi]|uniref:malate dehydrogenase n=1 Tax=Heracleum sosnowskyi TaxID=360622 RepID=A0AAD8HV47_9APIA|nr:hypothetical protein POM88_029572 [Heracleum sosnowskyi]
MSKELQLILITAIHSLRVLDVTGTLELDSALKGVEVVVLPAGVLRKPGVTRDDLFNVNANIAKTLVKADSEHCPDAIINTISNPVNSTMPIAAEVLGHTGVYGPKKLFGVMTIDVFRPNMICFSKEEPETH